MPEKAVHEEVRVFERFFDHGLPELLLVFFELPLCLLGIKPFFDIPVGHTVPLPLQSQLPAISPKSLNFSCSKVLLKCVLSLFLKLFKCTECLAESLLGFSELLYKL